MTAKCITITKKTGEKIVVAATIVGRFGVHRAVASHKTHYEPNYGFSISHIDSGLCLFVEFAFARHCDAVLVAGDMERLFPAIRFFFHRRDGLPTISTNGELNSLHQAMKHYCERTFQLKPLVIPMVPKWFNEEGKPT